MPMLGRIATQVLDHVGVERADVLGVSWGGALAQQVALAAPGRVRRVVLANTNFGGGSIPAAPSALRALLSTRRFRDSGSFADALVTSVAGRRWRTCVSMQQRDLHTRRPVVATCTSRCRSRRGRACRYCRSYGCRRCCSPARTTVLSRSRMLESWRDSSPMPNSSSSHVAGTSCCSRGLTNLLRRSHPSWADDEVVDTCDRSASTKPIAA